MKRKTIHLILFTIEGMILAALLACGIISRAVSLGKLPLADSYHAHFGDILEFNFKAGQEQALSRIDHFRVYYKTKGDRELSSRQTFVIKANKENLLGPYFVKMQKDCYAFRLDCQYDKHGCSVEKDAIVFPEIASLRFCGRKLDISEMIRLPMPQYAAIGLMYEPKIPYNGQYALLSMVWLILFCVIMIFVVISYNLVGKSSSMQ